MPPRLRPTLLSFAALALAMSPAAPALASSGPALSPGIVHHDSSAWSLVPTTDQRGSILYGVSCVSATDCTAVGAGGIDKYGMLVESWNGTAWSVASSPHPGSGFLNGISCVSATACTAVGQYWPSSHSLRLVTLVESWNGTGWSVMPTPNKVSNSNYLNGVSCVPAAACNAVGSYQKPGVRYGGEVKSLAESNDIVPSSR